MIDFEKIEDKVFEYMNNNGRSPKYILLDEITHEILYTDLKRKDVIKFPVALRDYLIPVFYSAHSSLPIEILSVNINRNLCEAVG